MSQPYNDIKQAITDAAKPIEERRPQLPNWFELVYMEDYADDRQPGISPDPTTGAKDRDGKEDLPGANKKGGR